MIVSGTTVQPHVCLPCHDNIECIGLQPADGYLYTEMLCSPIAHRKLERYH